MVQLIIVTPLCWNLHDDWLQCYGTHLDWPSVHLEPVRIDSYILRFWCPTPLCHEPLGVVKNNNSRLEMILSDSSNWALSNGIFRLKIHPKVQRWIQSENWQNITIFNDFCINPWSISSIITDFGDQHLGNTLEYQGEILLRQTWSRHWPHRINVRWQWCYNSAQVTVWCVSSCKIFLMSKSGPRSYTY